MAWILTKECLLELSDFLLIWQICSAMSMADQECARGGGVSHILAEKKLLASLY